MNAPVRSAEHGRRGNSPGVRVAVYVNGRQKRRCKEVQRQRYVKTWQAGSTTAGGRRCGM
jgi:hypothetical protein